MTQSVIDYAMSAFELDNSELDLSEVEDLLKDNPELFEMLCDPAVSEEDKHAAIDKVFQDSVRDFLKLFVAETEKTLHAELIYCDAPSEAQLEAIKNKLMKLYDKPEVELTLTEDKSIIGGFLLRACGRELDYSIKSRLEDIGRRLCQK